MSPTRLQIAGSVILYACTSARIYAAGVLRDAVSAAWWTVQDLHAVLHRLRGRPDPRDFHIYTLTPEAARHLHEYGEGA